MEIDDELAVLAVQRKELEDRRLALFAAKQERADREAALGLVLRLMAQYKFTPAELRGER